MSGTVKVVSEFLDWCVEMGSERGYDVSRQNDLLVDEPRFVARTRYTVDQGLNTQELKPEGTANFKVTDEVETRVDRFDKVHSIILDVHNTWTWDPDRDDFYPLTTRYLRRQSSEDVNGDYPVRLDLTGPSLRHRRNDLNRLFPNDEQSGNDGLDPHNSDDPTDDLDGGGGFPDEAYRVGTISNLRRIAEQVDQ